MKMAFDYERKGNTVANPNSQWVLSKVDVTNSVSTEEGKTGDVYTTSYEYGEGRYDRTERQFYGFESVSETRPDGSVFGTKYHNQDFYKKGLAYETTTKESAAGIEYRKTLIVYELLDKKCKNGGTNCASNDLNAAFPAATEQTNIFKEKDPEGREKKNIVSNKYDNLGNITEEKDYGDDNTNDDDTFLEINYSADNGTLAAKYIMGKPTRVIVKDASGRVLRKREADYDAKGNLTWFKGYITATGSVAATELRYDSYGNLVKLIDPGNYTIDYTYDTEVVTHITEIRDSFDYKSTAAYNYNYGVVTRSADLNGNAMNYQYDQFGRMTKVWGPYLAPDDPAPSLQMTYFHKELPARAVTENREDYLPGSTRTITTVIVIDSLKRVIQTRKDAEVYQNGATVSGMTVTGRVMFDDMGLVIKQGQPVFQQSKNESYTPVELKNPTSFEYDKLGRTTKVITPYTAGNDAETITEYKINSDTNWLETRVTDAKGKKKYTFMDINSRIRKIHEFNANEAIETKYEYNAIGEITKVTDANGNETKISYDTLGRRTAIDNPDAGLTEYRYDLSGNLLKKIDAKLWKKGLEIKYEYEYNRLKKIDYPGEETDTAYTYGGAAETEFNRAGRIKKITDESGITELKYGRLGETTETYREITIEGGKVMRFTTTQRFDSFGRMKELTYPDGEYLKYAYDDGGLLKSASSVFRKKTFNYLNLLAYDEFGQRAYLSLGNNTNTKYEYDALTRRLAKLETHSQQEKHQDINYAYDKVGNILNIRDNVHDSLAQDFEYDDLHRLAKAIGNYTFHAGESSDYKVHRYERVYHYDNIHRMERKEVKYQITEPDGDITHPPHDNYDLTYQYAAARPHAVEKAIFQYPYRDGLKENFSYNYDPSGNLVYKLQEQNQHIRDLKWHPDNRLRQVKDRDVSETYFVYDADGERVRKNGQYGETVYVNQFFSIRNTVISSKHFFAGNTRLATKLTQIGEREALSYLDTDTESTPGTVSEAVGGDIKIKGSGKYLHQPQGKAKGYYRDDKGTGKGKGKGHAYAYGKDKDQKGLALGKGKDKDNKGKALGKDKKKNIDKKKSWVDEQREANARKIFEKQNRGKGKGKDTEGKALGKDKEKDDSKGKAVGKEKDKGQIDKVKRCQGKGKGLADECDESDLEDAKEKNEKRGLGPVKAKGNAFAYGFYRNRGEDPPYSDGDTKWPGDKTGKGFGRGSGIFRSAEWQLFYYHYDHLGSTSLNTDERGKVYEKTLYFPFGEVWREEGIDVEKDLLGFKFTGKELDQETGYYYFGARYYEPVLSVWMSADPAIDRYIPRAEQIFFPQKPFAPSEDLPGQGGVYYSINLNIYHYASLNPIRYFDPDGKVPVAVLWVFKAVGEGATDVALDKAIASAKGEKFGASDALKSFGIGTGIGLLGLGAANKIKKLNKLRKIRQLKQIKNLRQSAVRQAWKQEKALVKKTGEGTRRWKESESKELLKTGKVKGYEGHHIKSVKSHPKYTGNPDNIEFVKKGSEHLSKHGGDYKNPTSGDLMNRSKLIE
jgi:RHS repeat-associated protein